MIRPREVEGRPRQPLDPSVVVELRPVVGRHRLHVAGAADESGQPPAQAPRRSVSEFADEYQPGLALDEGGDAVLAARAHHGVGLPVADLSARLHLRWPLRDQALARQSAAAIVSAVALPPPLARPAEVGVEESSLLLVSPDVAVGRLVADAEEPDSAQVTRDLLGTPLPAEQLLD